MSGRPISIDAYFLGLPIKTRDRATALFSEIKADMKRHYALKELGLRAYTWDDASLNEFMSLPKAQHVRALTRRRKSSTSRRNLINRSSR